MQNTQGQGTLFGVAALDGAVCPAALSLPALLFGVCLLTLSAKLQVPFWPVPMTMQTLVVLMLGMAYGPRLGAGTVLAYLLVGAAGLPVFAGTPERGIGLAYMMGPTGGFLMGFVAGGLDHRCTRRARLGQIGALGARLPCLPARWSFLCSGLAALIPITGLSRAIETGLVPFLASSALKIALGAVAMPLIWRVLGRRHAMRP